MPVVHLHSHLRKSTAISRVVFHVAGTGIHLAAGKSRKVVLRDVNSHPSALVSVSLFLLLLPTQHFGYCVTRASTKSIINSNNKKTMKYD